MITFTDASSGSFIATDGNIFNGTGSPVGVLSAAGPAMYFDNTDPANPVAWLKSTTPVNNTDWVIMGQFSNS